MTRIEWTDETWNPITGCTKVSAGCKHCYAERIAGRFWKDRKFTDVRFHPERLEQPLRWRKSRRIFVNSMSDLFHGMVHIEWQDEIFDVMKRCPQHTFLILTKRPESMLGQMRAGLPVLPNAWLGVSVEDQATADARIPILLDTPAAVRFVSYEPALGPVDLSSPWLTGWTGQDLVDWVIAGGESGPHARTCNIEWIRSVKDQCVEAGVPFFFKQIIVNGKKVSMPELDGRTWGEFPRRLS